MGKRSTKTHKVPEVRQASLLEVGQSQAPHPIIEGVRFDRGDRARLFVGIVPLAKYLEAEGLKWVLRLATLMDELDWSAFEASYKPGGRPPLHPKMVVGLIMYGMMLKQSSLRQLEALARRDVGAWWVAGGLTPDFTTFTKFIQRHSQLLSDDFFVQTTSRIVKQLKLTRSDLAIDGTVVQAAASTAGALKREAMQKQLVEAKDEGDTQSVAKLEAASAVLAEREAARALAGKKPDSVVVSPLEPEAVNQPKKNSKDYQLAYKPTLGTHPSGLIVGQSLSATSENECVPAILEHHERVFGAQPQRALADAGFLSIPLLALFVAKDLDVLMPSGRRTKEKKGREGRFPTSNFVWDAEAGAPRCPAGRTMTGGQTVQHDRAGRAYRQYRGRECGTCPLREQCTKSTARNIKRFEGDEMKAAMAEVMRHPEAQQAYRQRAAIVEPSIARLKGGGLTRFRRRGRQNARLELSLNCVAHNLRLLLWGRGGVLVVLCITARPGEPWRVTAVGVALFPPFAR